MHSSFELIMHLIQKDFCYSDGWLTGFKNHHSLYQFKKQGEVISASSTKSIENDRFALQQLLESYSSENI
ncbi:7945_t:CDS:2 [Funneliformis mosseae]|uniref:7945_t:CDS:1 n=1 Tax=Funneliformis mosseae TaxID=27381 RepID=A0A9N8V3R7_FUNMO|nr:7945_t:CDS:2 [Funneliformis mosseae]